MARKNRIKFIEYYTRIFDALEVTNPTYFQENKYSADKALAAWDHGYWDISSVRSHEALILDKKGCLNVGICPFCGHSQIGESNTWAYTWKWYNGPVLNICRECYNQGTDGIEKPIERTRNIAGGLLLSIIYGYLIVSIIIGSFQYLYYGGLSLSYLITQWTIFGISIFSNLYFRKSHKGVGNVLAIISGGIAMMDIIQAVIFYILGDFIDVNISLNQAIILFSVAVGIFFLIYRHLTSSVRKNDNRKREHIE